MRPELSMTVVDLAHYKQVANIPVPDAVLDAVNRHVDLLTRFFEAEEAVDDARGELAAAERADAQAIVKAIEADEPIKAPNFDKAKAAVDRAQQIVNAFTGPIARSAAAVSQALDPHREEMLEGVADWVDNLVREVQRAEAAVVAAKGKLGEAQSLRSWISDADVRNGIAAGARLKSLGRTRRRGRTPVPSELAG